MPIEDDIYALLQVVDGKVDDLATQIGTPVDTDIATDIANVASDLDTLSTQIDQSLVPLSGLAVIHSFDRQSALSPNGIQNITDLNAETFLTVPAGSTAAFIAVETEAVRFTNDGVTAPTSSVGVLLTAGSKIFVLSPEVLANLQFINAQANDAALSVSYFK